VRTSTGSRATGSCSRTGWTIECNAEHSYSVSGFEADGLEDVGELVTSATATAIFFALGPRRGSLSARACYDGLGAFN
jgi:hypothetical protein